MLETAVALICAHLLADFVLQNDRMVAHKKEWRVMALHIGLVGASAALMLLTWNVALLLILVTSHLAIDVIKIWWLDDHARPFNPQFSKLTTFALDQALHLGIIVLLVWVWPEAAAHGWWGSLPAQMQIPIWAAMAGAAGFIVAVPAGGVVIRMITQSIALKPAIGGLRAGGRYIGWLERSLTFLFVLYGHPEGVGFLLTAKSILRFGDITDTKQRKNTEYIIIGTMLSFGWALLAAIMTSNAVNHWLS